MSTHRSPCLVCGEMTYCCNDEHVLGVDIYNSPGSCENSDESIGNFCSVQCFIELECRMAERKKIAKETNPEWFTAKQVSP